MGQEDALLPEGWKFIWGKLPFKEMVLKKEKLLQKLQIKENTQLLPWQKNPADIFDEELKNAGYFISQSFTEGIFWFFEYILIFFSKLSNNFPWITCQS